MGKSNVSFLSSGLKLAGHLYTPEEKKQGSKLPAVICVSPWSSVKEQTSGLYAEKLSRYGFVALAFDHRHYGESEGQPRCYENPAGKVEDISCAVDFLTCNSLVDPHRVGVLGICAGGSYVTEAAAVDRRIKAVTTITGVTNLRSLLLKDLKMGREGTLELLDSASAQRSSQAAGEEALLVDLIDADNDSKGLPKYVGSHAVAYYTDPKRGAVPSYLSKVAVSSYSKVFASSAVDLVGYISPHPLLIIGGTKSDSAHFQQEAYDAALEPKELFWVESATHNDLYDEEKVTQQAAEKAAAFFKKSLASP